MAIALEVLLEGHRQIQQAYANARREVLQRWRRTVEGQMLTGVKIVQRQYRSMSAVGPGGTTVRTGNLRSSYTQRTQVRGNEVVGEMGLMRFGARGKALVYGPVWELGALMARRGKRARRVTPRPAAGALNLAAQQIRPALVGRLEQDIRDVVGG